MIVESVDSIADQIRRGLVPGHGLRKDGQREDDLLTELQFMRDLFYGLYLVSAEDIGMRPLILDDEPVDRPHCYQTLTTPRRRLTSVCGRRRP